MLFVGLITIQWNSVNTNTKGTCHSRWALSIQPKIPEILVENQIERTLSVRSDRKLLTTFEGRSDRNVPIVAPSTALLYPAYENKNQPCDGLGLVCTTGMYRSIGQVKFPKFQTEIFVEWKAARVSVLSGLLEKKRKRKTSRRHILLMLRLKQTLLRGNVV